jgi:hypothetical protein
VRAKGGPAAPLWTRLAGGMDRGLAVAGAALTPVRSDVQDWQAVDTTRRPSEKATGEGREAQGNALQQEWEASGAPRHRHCAPMMGRCEPGLVVGGEAAAVPVDNWDVARWCKCPTGHERRLHGRRHAGVRLVRQGPTLLLVLDAHLPHDGVLTVDDLAPYRHAQVPTSQREAVERGQSRRQARSRKKRQKLLADLDKRYFHLS